MFHYDRHTRGIASVSLVFDIVWLWPISFTIHDWLQSTCIVYRWISRLNRRKRSSIVPKTENMFLSFREMQIENLFDIIYSSSHLFVSVFSRLFPKNGKSSYKFITNGIIDYHNLLNGPASFLVIIVVVTYHWKNSWIKARWLSRIMFVLYPERLFRNVLYEKWTLDCWTYRGD